MELCVENNTDGLSFVGDKEQLCRALTNLVDNAICVSKKEDKVVMSAEIIHINNKTNLVIKVIDDGCGIPENALKTLFDPFFTTKSNGTGLGLANVRKIIELHNGTVEVDNRLEQGAVFTIVLPISG